MWKKNKISLDPGQVLHSPAITLQIPAQIRRRIRPSLHEDMDIEALLRRLQNDTTKLRPLDATDPERVLDEMKLAGEGTRLGGAVDEDFHDGAIGEGDVNAAVVAGGDDADGGGVGEAGVGDVALDPLAGGMVARVRRVVEIEPVVRERGAAGETVGAGGAAAVAGLAPEVNHAGVAAGAFHAAGGVEAGEIRAQAPGGLAKGPVELLHRVLEPHVEAYARLGDVVRISVPRGSEASRQARIITFVRFVAATAEEAGIPAGSLVRVDGVLVRPVCRDIEDVPDVLALVGIR